jgi:hypothetical protein
LINLFVSCFSDCFSLTDIFWTRWPPVKAVGLVAQ